MIGPTLQLDNHNFWIIKAKKSKSCHDNVWCCRCCGKRSRLCRWSRSLTESSGPRVSRCTTARATTGTGRAGELWLAESGSRDRGAHLWLVQVGAQHQDAVRELGRVCGGGAAVRRVRVRAVPGQAALPRQLSQVDPTIQYNKLRHCCLHGTRIKGDYEYLCTKFCITIIKVDGNGKCKLLQNDTWHKHYLIWCFQILLKQNLDSPNFSNETLNHQQNYKIVLLHSPQIWFY